MAQQILPPKRVLFGKIFGPGKMRLIIEN